MKNGLYNIFALECETGFGSDFFCVSSAGTLSFIFIVLCTGKPVGALFRRVDSIWGWSRIDN